MYYCTHIPTLLSYIIIMDDPGWSTRLCTTLSKLESSKLCITAPTSRERAWDIRLDIWPIVLKTRLTVCWDVMKLRFKLYYVHDDKTRLLTCSSLMMIGNPGASYCPWQRQDFFGGPPLLLQLLRRVHLWDRIHVGHNRPSTNLFSPLERILSLVDNPYTCIQISYPSTSTPLPVQLLRRVHLWDNIHVYPGYFSQDLIISLSRGFQEVKAISYGPHA